MFNAILHGIFWFFLCEYIIINHENKVDSEKSNFIGLMTEMGGSETAVLKSSKLGKTNDGIVFLVFDLVYGKRKTKEKHEI
jgi:hypothetical protein